LPTEIVIEIFVQFLPGYPRCPPSTGPFSPTLLTHICRRWREIALGVPTLWRAIPVSFYDIPLEKQNHISDFLRRSGSCPLSIQSYDLSLAVPEPEVFAAIVPHRTRWEHLSMRLSLPELPTIEGPLPLLRHLDLWIGENPDPADIVTFREVPLLRSVTLTVNAHSSVILPWTQLTSLALNTVYRSEYLPILQQAPNLVQCELRILYEHDVDDHLVPHEITLRSVESLTLEDSETDWEGSFPDIFIVPALRSLEISSSFLGPDPIDALKSFLLKSGSQPQELCISR
ncbi:hypothetical protein B0H14DRAFT_3704863, partial [Mycena olivaceomarginata]